MRSANSRASSPRHIESKYSGAALTSILSGSSSPRGEGVILDTNKGKVSRAIFERDKRVMNVIRDASKAVFGKYLGKSPFSCVLREAAARLPLFWLVAPS